MIRLSFIALAAAAAVLPAAASAQSLGYYVATPAPDSKLGKVTTRGTPWFVRDGNLIAARAPETSAKVCEMVVRKVGTLSAFAAAGRSFSADELGQCNAAAAPAATRVAKAD